MKNEFNVAIVGATGAVGETILEVLQQRCFPVAQLYLLASESSAGKRYQFSGKTVLVEALDSFDFSLADIAFFSAGAKISAEFAPKAAAQGCKVIDNTSQFRYDDDKALIVPEVNAAALEATESNIIANPNCSTIQMLVALKPIYDAVGIKRINVATYQAVSGAGKPAMEELAAQTAQLLNMKKIEQTVFPKQIAFNVLPQIDVFMENGYTKEEMKMVWETKKILADDDVQVNPTAVRVPVFYGHSEALHVETVDKLSANDAKALLKKAPSVTLLDSNAEGGYPTPVTEASGNDSVYVGRIREDISCENGLNLWVVSDNVRKGAATNSVQIAELLAK